MTVDNPLPESGIGVEPAAELGEEVAFRSVGLRRGLERIILDCLGPVSGDGSQRRGTARAEGLRPTQRRRASRTLVDSIAGVSVVSLGDVVVVEDLLIEFLVTHGGIDAEHVRVDLPRGAVLDSLLGESLTNPAGDGRVSEVMEVDTVAVDTSVVGDILDAAGEIAIFECAVILAVPVTRRFVDDRRAVDIPAGVGVEIGRQMAFRPRQRDGPRRILDVRILVDSDERALPAGVKVLNPQAGDGPDTQARVGKQRDECFVSGVASGIEQRLDFVVGQEVVGVDFAVGRDADGDVVGPRLATPAMELLECLAVVAPRPIAEAVVVFQVEQQGVDSRPVHLDEWTVPAFGREADAIQQRDDGPRVALAVSVEVANPLVDSLAVTLVNIGVIDLRELVLELSLVGLDIIEVSHTYHIRRVDYQTSRDGPGWTTQNSYIIHESERCVDSRSETVKPGVRAAGTGMEVVA